MRLRKSSNPPPADCAPPTTTSTVTTTASNLPLNLSTAAQQVVTPTSTLLPYHPYVPGPPTHPPSTSPNHHLPASPHHATLPGNQQLAPQTIESIVATIFDVTTHVDPDD